VNIIRAHRPSMTYTYIVCRAKFIEVEDRVMKQRANMNSICEQLYVTKAVLRAYQHGGTYIEPGPQVV
jgi:hypothetical protein